MATIQEYRRAAALFEQAAVDARSLIAPVDASMGPEVLDGGVLSRSVVATIDRHQSEARALAIELERLAGECLAEAASLALLAEAATEQMV